MKVQYSRPHLGGCMTGIGVDTKVVSLPDTDTVPAGATQVDAATPESDWTWSNGSFGAVPTPPPTFTTPVSAPTVEGA